MTLALARPTGSSLGDYEQLAAHDATVAARHTRLRAVGDPTLRDTLVHFEDTISASMATVAMLRARAGLTETFLVEHGTTFFDVVSTITEQAADDLDDEAPSSVAGNDDAVSLVEGLAARLGVPVGVILAAAGISKSTFHTWKPTTGKAPRPRVASQGRLWALAQAVEDLEELLGGSPRGWLLADQRRLALLRRGEFDALVRAAEPPPSPRVADAPAYAAAYAVGGDRTGDEVTEVAVVHRRTLPAAPVAQRARRPR